MLVCLLYQSSKQLQNSKKNFITKKLNVHVFPQVKLHFTENALHLIAMKASAKQTGARGLRSIMEDILTEAMFEVNLP
jgi:ATP-dependent Clp protease ATP-binding subunit ClpX